MNNVSNTNNNNCDDMECDEDIKDIIANKQIESNVDNNWWRDDPFHRFENNVILKKCGNRLYWLYSK